LPTRKKSPGGESSSQDPLTPWDGAVVIPIDQLVLCDWNVNEMDEPEFAALIEEIRAGGFDEPCQVVRIKDGPEKGNHLIIGGEHRYKASLALNHKTVPCVVKDHLSDADEETLMEWSVKRNNIRGKINRARFAELQKRITGRWGISAEAAKRRMLVREERMEALQARFSPEVIETMMEEGREGLGDGSGPRAPSEEIDLGSSPDTRRPPKDDKLLTPDQKSRKQAFADRRALLTSLKAFQQDVLQQSADTVEQGYLYFGVAGHTHLVVNEEPALNKLIGEMVEACKANSDKINEFLITAIRKELPSWQ
jgi:ParB-like chromosome segregation protein Spo0J